MHLLINAIIQMLNPRRWLTDKMSCLPPFMPVAILLGMICGSTHAATATPTQQYWRACENPFAVDCATTQYSSAAQAIDEFKAALNPARGYNYAGNPVEAYLAFKRIDYHPVLYVCVVNYRFVFCDGKSGYVYAMHDVFYILVDLTEGWHWQFLSQYSQRFVWSEIRCPSGKTYNSRLNLCEAPADPKNNGTGQTCIGNPVNAGVANKYQVETDYSGSGQFPLIFKRYYNSNLVDPVNMGAQWRSSYDRSIVNAGNTAKLYRPDGKILNFSLSGNDWLSTGDVFTKLFKISGGWTYLNEDDETESYDVNGRLLSIANRAGLTQSLAYDAEGRLSAVTDSSGHNLAFTYSGSLLSAMVVPGGGIYTYQYKNSGSTAERFGITSEKYGVPVVSESNSAKLESIIFPDGARRNYHYDEVSNTGEVGLTGFLTGITDENGVRYATYQYAADGKAVSTGHANGADLHSLAYNPDGTTTVTDPLGTQRTYNFTTILGVAKSTGQSQPGGSGCGPASSAITYDANGNVARRTDFNGSRTCYAYDLSRNLETARVEGLAPGKACPADITGYAPASGTVERAITTAWHPSFRLPVSVTEPGRVTSYSYDDRGNLTQKSIRDTATNAMRTWSWSYTYSSLAPGLVVQKVEDGPRTDVNDLTTTAYYAADAYCDGGHNGCRGQVSQITNALGHVTRITRYNAHGQPEEIVDPNSLVTTLEYDARQRLVARTAGSERTGYEYDRAGQPVRVTRPDGSSLNYDYDAAHRLVGIADSLGNAISYTLDAMGNRVKEDVRDPAGQLAQTRSREYDALNRLYKDIGAAGQTTTYAYDAQDNLKQTTDPLTHSTASNYDALDRLIRTTDPAGGQVQNAYDALDRVTRVTDPKGVATTYTYNGLGDLLSEVSADRGTTAYTYDSAGNLLTRTDARGVTHATRYDALNRPIARVHTAPRGIPATPDITWQYDAGPNGIGRMSGMTDETGSTAFGYDDHGRLLGKTQTTTFGKTSLTHTLGYSYDNAGRLTRQTYPSGAQLDLAYGLDGRPLEIRVNGQVLVSDIVFQPLGAPRAWTWGNGTPYARQFDADGRLDQYPVWHETRSLGFDAAGRIVNFSHANPVLNRYFEYDAADRLTKEIDNIGVSLWAYDLNGNRQSATLGANTYAYTYPTTSNRLTGVAGPVAKTYTHDAAGNITGDGLTTFTYNAAGRLAEAETKGHGRRRLNTYLHNALGQRVIKDGSYLINGPYIFVYDEQGHLVGEYDAGNQVRQETVWLGDTPIAVLKKDLGGQVQTYYVHADHLGTPRAIVDGQNRMVWRWLGSAFGQGLPEEDPDGDGKTFEYNLRYPGQYWDRETGLHYNYFRDYDPSTGRYPQFDPIGLAGGLNLYEYGNSNPLSYIDPMGLTGVLPGPIPLPLPPMPINPGAGSGGTNSNAVPYPGGGRDRSDRPTDRPDRWDQDKPKQCSDDEDKCKKRKQYCITFCQYELDMPGRRDNFGPFRACIRRCMNAAGCNDF